MVLHDPGVPVHQRQAARVLRQAVRDAFGELVASHRAVGIVARMIKTVLAEAGAR
ncbi:MAG: hypothetical protein QM788_11420 [Roseateles sp.]|uniref:hypothetical protein n=1 Tax=Roseateles sp. TaxID=1971397 RepID=UPI0039EB561E